MRVETARYSIVFTVSLLSRAFAFDTRLLRGLTSIPRGIQRNGDVIHTSDVKMIPFERLDAPSRNNP